MKSILIAKEIKLCVIDNIASLAGGLDENVKKDWDPINQWLLELRFAGISTILLHHTNKTGEQRGTSGREDNIDTSIMLKKPGDYAPEDGAKFIIHFSKARVETSRLGLISDTEFKLTLDKNKDHVWVYGNVTAKLKDEVLQFLHEGLSQTEVAKTFGVNKATVSKIRKNAIKDGLLTPKNRLIPDIK
jgi:predicted XRE-type DNA-binding protein